MEITAKVAVPEKVRWLSGIEDGRVGIAVESAEGTSFVPWDKLKVELELNLLSQMGRVLGSRSYTLETAEFHGRKDWLVHIVDDAKKSVGSVWLGGDPDKGWQWDGLVRVGHAPNEHTAKVWQVFTRYSDGSYRRAKPARDTPEDRIAS